MLSLQQTSGYLKRNTSSLQQTSGYLYTKHFISSVNIWLPYIKHYLFSKHLVTFIQSTSSLQQTLATPSLFRNYHRNHYW